MGATVPTAHIDEIAYFNYIWITFPTLIAATIRAGEDAAKAGKRHGNIYTTTAGRPDTETGRFAFNLFNEAAAFTERMYDCKDKPDLIDLVKKNSAKGKTMVYAVFSHRQLGKTDAWLREVVLRTSASSQEDVDRDYLNLWKAGQEFGPIPPNLLKLIHQSMKEPKHIDMEDNYMTRWYVHKEVLDTADFKNKSLILSMDSGEQIGNDYTSFVIMDPADMGVVGTLRCNDSNIIRLARRAADLMVTYPNMVYIPEAKSTGRAILDYIIDDLVNRGINPWTRIYNRAVQCRDENQFKDFNIYTEPADGLNRKLFGFVTSGGDGPNSRNQLYKGTLLKSLNLNHSRVRDETLIKEFCALCIKNGRIDHGNGRHDDLVIAYLLASYLLFFGKNLHMYGLSKDHILSSISSTGKDIDPNLKSFYTEINAQIKKLEDLLDNCPPSELIRHSYLRKLNDLRRMLDKDEIVTEPITKMQMDTHARSIANRSMGINSASAAQLSRFF